MPQRLSDVPMADLVPETRDWNDGHGIDLEAWIGCIGSIEHAIAYGELFWPEFVELDGCVFFAGVTEKGYSEFMQQTGGDKRAVETVLNHRHILDLFSGSRPSCKQVVYLGRCCEKYGLPSWPATSRIDGSSSASQRKRPRICLITRSHFFRCEGSA
jgi:hypothetical protein